MARMSEETRFEIKYRWAEGESISQIAKDLGLKYNTVWHFLGFWLGTNPGNGETYKLRRKHAKVPKEHSLLPQV